MNRDLDLCREILRALEAHLEPLHPDKPKIDGRSQEEVAYNLEQLCDARLVWSEFRKAQSLSADAELAEKISQYMHRNQDRHRLTLAGHEFLDVARNDTLYNRAKEMLLEKGGWPPLRGP